jgi:hypothetical protein
VSRSDVIGLIGVILTIVFGIPAVPLFAEGNIALGVLTIALALIILALTGYVYWRLELPPYTILTHESRIEILDAQGRRAAARKTIALRPNYRGADHYTHRNISCDGAVEFAVDPGVVLVQQQRAAGDYFVTVRFPHQLPCFRKAPPTWIEMLFTDAFLGNNESFSLLVDQPIKMASIEVLFPAARHPVPGSVRAVYRYSGHEEELAPPQLAGNRITMLLARKYRLLRYGEYEVMWRW